MKYKSKSAINNLLCDSISKENAKSEIKILRYEINRLDDQVKSLNIIIENKQDIVYDLINVLNLNNI